ncbi:Ppx/GppA family phosphatase [Idiomarina tyrosinivorans]|nr:Ppx/GppA family phosphatase [Idiomarina tyrosinivorans]
MTRYAAIDMGSNSFHLLMAERSDNDHPAKIVRRIKQKVRLAADFNEYQSHIGSDAVARASECLKQFSLALAAFKPDLILAVATAAMRQADNQTEVLTKLQRALGQPIEIISGRTEAAIIFRGVTQHLQHQENVLVMDIGGASTEVILGQPHHHASVLNSVELGCVTQQSRFFSDGRISAEAVNAAVSHAETQLAAIAGDYQHANWHTTLGASGTFRALAEMAAAENRSLIDANWVDEVIVRCIQQGHIQRLRFSGLRQDRRAVLIGGLTVLRGLIRSLGFNQISVSQGALREGLLAILCDPTPQLPQLG